jgi:hypothetical protein
MALSKDLAPEKAYLLFLNNPHSASKDEYDLE